VVINEEDDIDTSDKVPEEPGVVDYLGANNEAGDGDGKVSMASGDSLMDDDVDESGDEEPPRRVALGRGEPTVRKGKERAVVIDEEDDTDTSDKEVVSIPRHPVPQHTRKNIRERYDPSVREYMIVDGWWIIKNLAYVRDNIIKMKSSGQWTLCALQVELDQPYEFLR
jgi:hypothetical protein